MYSTYECKTGSLVTVASSLGMLAAPTSSNTRTSSNSMQSRSGNSNRDSPGNLKNIKCVSTNKVKNL